MCIYKLYRETALLEVIQDPNEIRDCEGKRALSQTVTCMELVQTRFKKEIQAIDQEIINKKLHAISQIYSLNDKYPNQELLALGLSKGSVILLHVLQMSKVFCRFTIHRESIELIKYLPKTRMFITFCVEKDLKFWRVINRERRH